MKIDPYYHRQKCKPMTLVYGGIRFIQMLSVAALRCGKAVQMHYQFVAMHCQLHCLYFNKKDQLSLTNPRDACEMIAQFM